MGGSKPIANQGAADSIQGPQGGLYLPSSSAAAEFALAAWANRYVDVYIIGADTYLLFAAATGATIDETATSATAASPDATIPAPLGAGSIKSYMVDPNYPFLRFKTTGAAGGVRIFRS